MAIENSTSRLDNVQALRALAAMLVVLVHAHALGIKGGHDLSFIAGFDPWGVAGVDLFFVISGFIMVHIHEARPRGPGRFLADRATRIAPLYWAVTGLFALGVAVGIMAPVDAGGGQPWTSLLFVSQPVSGSRPLVYVGWTLEYEAFFYACFAASIVMARRFRVDLLLPLFALVLGAIALVGIGMVAVEFLFGALVARALARVRPGRRIGGALLVGGAVLLALSFGQGEAVEYRALVFGLPAAMIVAGAVILPHCAGRIGALLGDASYSLYLIHLFVLAFVFALLVPGEGVTTLISALAVVQLIAIAVHRWVERPLNAAARGLVTTRKEVPRVAA